MYGIFEGKVSNVPLAKTKDPAKSRNTTATLQPPTLMDACDLIGIMLDYEATARKNGTDLSSGRFSMLTASEREFLQAELIADYIRLSAGNMGNTPGYFDASLREFCSKICDMELTSHELIGTYLAALDIVTKNEKLRSVPRLVDAVRGTMITDLRGCVELLGARAASQS